MKKLFVLVIVVTFCGLFAQGVDWNITGAGSRAMAMGGAFIGVADDATAITWNPAGLYSLERMEASVVGQYYSEDYEIDGGSAGYIDGGNDIFVLNFASFAYPIKKFNLTTAIALQRQLEIYDYTDYGGGDWDELSGAASTLTVGAGSRFMNIFAAGFSANIWLGSYTYEQEFSNNYFETTSDFSGLNFGLGGMIDLNYLTNPLPLKIGLAIKTPFDLMVDEEYGESKYQMPLMLGIGTSYRLGESLTISADFETRGFKDKMYMYEGDNGSYDEDVLSLDNLNQFRIGAEYIFVSDFAVIPFRAGFQNVPTTNYDMDENQIVGTGFSFGSGLIFERFAIDIFAYFATFEADLGFADYTSERLRTGISGIIYF